MAAELPGEDMVLDGPLQQRLDALTWMVANGLAFPVHQMGQLSHLISFFLTKYGELVLLVQ